MKRMIVLLLVLLLASHASAETLREQIAAPETVRATFASHTGKTVISVDAAVRVPEADAAYLIPVSPTHFGDERVPVLAELLWPGLGSAKLEVEDENDTGAVNGIIKYKFMKHTACILKNGTRQEDIDVQVYNVYYRSPHQEDPYGASLQGHHTYDGRYRQKETVNYSHFIDFPIEGDGIGGHSLNSAEAIQIASSFLRSITEEPFELFEIGQTKGRYYTSDPFEGSHVAENQPSYALSYTRVIDGIPLLASGGSFMSSVGRDDVYVPPVGYEEVMFAINREGTVTSFDWRNPYEISAERLPVTLLPFETILSIAEKTMPLQYQYWEVHGDVGLHVYRIDLGYMAILQRDTLTFALTPVWNFYGYDVPLDPNMGIRPLLTVNAVDGTVIDLAYGY